MSMVLDTFILAVSGINIILVAALLYAYIKNFKDIPSSFTFGLILFAALFLIHNIVLFYFSVTMMMYYAAGLEPFVLVFTALQAAAFAVMNWITWT